MGKLKNIINLSKIFIVEHNKLNFINKNKKIDKKSPMLWVLIMIFFVISYFSYEIINVLLKIGEAELFLNGYFLFIGILIIIQAIILSVNIFYSSRNMENILCLPFTSVEILFAKFNTLLVIIYGTEFIFALCPFIIYGIYANMGILFFINLIISLIILPIFICFFIGSIIIILMNIIKIIKNKNVVELIISCFVILGFSFFMYYAVNYLIKDFESVDTVEQIKNIINLINIKIKEINSYFLVINPITDLLQEKNILKIIFSYIKLLIINLIGGFLFIIFGNKIYLKQLLKNNLYIKNNNYKKINYNNKLRKNKKSISYIKKEFKLLFRNPVLFMQQIFSSIIMTIIICIIIIIISPNIINFLNLEENKDIAEMIKFDFEIVCIFLGIAQIPGLFNFTSLTAFSKEGSDFYIIKLLPISFYKQFIYKNIPQILINFIFSFIILGTLYLNFAGISLKYYIIIFILSFLLHIINSFILCLIDLINPKINWKAEYEILQNNKNKIFQYGLIIINILFLMYMYNIFIDFNLDKSLFVFINILIFIFLILDYLIFKFNKKILNLKTNKK